MMILVILLVVIDIISKIIVSSLMKGNESIVIIKNFFNITYVRNTGAAWSFMADKTWLLVIISSVIIMGLLLYIKKNKPRNKREEYGYALVLAGAMGNFLERIFIGSVTDFFDFKIFSYDYPIFNLADCFIVIGIGLLLIETWRCKK